MLDVYELRQGNFEIIDSAMHEHRAKKKLYQRFYRFMIIILLISIGVILFLAVSSTYLWILAGLFPIVFGIVGYRNLTSLNTDLQPQISSILLDYNRSREIENFRIRKWQEGKLNEFIEEKVRYNQAIGFRVTWFDSGFLEVEIVVDSNFPGTPIFQTYDFFVIAELYNLFQAALPNLDKWFYQLEDGSQWSDEAMQDLIEDQKTAKVPWLIREYFNEL